MRIPLTAMSVSGRWHWPWNRGSWKGWLYLAIFVFVSGRLFVGQGFSLTLTSTSSEKKDPTVAGVIDIALKEQHGDRGLKMAFISSTWSSSPLGQGPKNSGDHISSTLHVNETQRATTTLLPEDKTSVDNQISESKKSSEETKKRKIEQVNPDKEKEYRYWLRSERIKQVCQNRGVVQKPPVFATNKNDTRPVHSPDSVNLPGKSLNRY